MRNVKKIKTLKNAFFKNKIKHIKSLSTSMELSDSGLAQGLSTVGLNALCDPRTHAPTFQVTGQAPRAAYLWGISEFKHPQNESVPVVEA